MCYPFSASTNPININISMYDSCEYRETQAQLAALLGTNSRIPLTSIAALAANTNTEIAFQQFRKDLFQIGVPEDLIQRNTDKIREILESQGMVASRQICSSDTRDKDQVLETAYKEYCENLYQLGFTKDLIPPKSKVLRILRSRGVVASSSVVASSQASSQSGGGDKGQLGRPFGIYVQPLTYKQIIMLVPMFCLHLR